ncbi:MAG TPA: tetratricopeptide repeat protein, partial [Rudaea sp.]
MSQSNPNHPLFDRALAAHRSGDLDAAHAAYSELIAQAPEHADALHLFAMLRHQQGASQEALSLLDRAIALAPGRPVPLANRASVRLALGDSRGAADDAAEAARIDPQSFGAWFNLGLAQRASGDLLSAARAFARASALRPVQGRALLEWFSAAAAAGATASVLARVRESLPALAAERERTLRVATALEQAGCAGAAFVLLTQLRRELPNDALVVARQQIEQAYGHAAMLERDGRIDAALSASEALIERAPDHRGARMLRAGILAERGEAEAASAEYRRLIEIVPRDPVAGSAALIAFQHDPQIGADEIARAHRDWAARHLPSPVPRWPREWPHADPQRPLRVGWLSPRFFSGLVANFFLEPLRCFDRASMRHVLYDSGGVEDSATAQFRAAADEWRRVDALDDDQLCEQIRADRIDVLVELSGHSPGNRLRALARRAAPVQVTWLDYFHSTCTAAIDFLVSDDVLSPPQLAANYTERVLALPSGRLCYTPPASAPQIDARDTGPLRLCSFNRVNKINDAVLACWSRVLAALPGSTLRLKARTFDNEDGRRHFLQRCERAGIAAGRLELSGYGEPASVFADYADCDIALDPFPFSGCATSLDALWMGLPVITRIGETMVSRQTA